MKKGTKNKLKLIITLVIIFGFVWVLVLSPMIEFHKNEEKVVSAAKRYFEINSTALPTGERIKTLSLESLYHGKYLDKDIHAPYTGKTCSISNSWVKVKRVNDEYQYFVYLDCGLLSSNIDHTGPVITLSGDSEITVGVGEKFQDPGVKSVVDRGDGKLKIDGVSVKGNVDTSKVGTYELVYSASDSLNNKGSVKRVVNVVKTFASTVKSILGDKTNFTGNPTNNYIRLSNMSFRIVGLTGDGNVMVVATKDVSFINYDGIDEWLDYYYNLLNDKTKEMIVEHKYCNMTLTDANLNTTSCNSYTDNKKVYIPSIVEINNAGDANNFMRLPVMSWISNPAENGKAYVSYTKNSLFGSLIGVETMPVHYNFSIRPMMVIRGDSYINGGNGTSEKPYTFGDSKKVKSGDLINHASVGEYVSINGSIFRIVDVLDDGTTKVVSVFSVGSVEERIEASADPDKDIITYNPKDKASIGYFINNRVNQHFDTTLFVSHTIKVPIYTDRFLYKKEVETKEYKVVLSAPNMYEIFSAIDEHDTSRAKSYWLLNTSKTAKIGAAVYDTGVFVNDEFYSFETFGIKIVGFVKDKAVASSGNGTFENPYILK